MKILVGGRFKKQRLGWMEKKQPIDRILAVFRQRLNEYRLSNGGLAYPTARRPSRRISPLDGWRRNGPAARGRGNRSHADDSVQPTEIHVVDRNPSHDGCGFLGGGAGGRSLRGGVPSLPRCTNYAQARAQTVEASTETGTHCPLGKYARLNSKFYRNAVQHSRRTFY